MRLMGLEFHSYRAPRFRCLYRASAVIVQATGPCLESCNILDPPNIKRSHDAGQTWHFDTNLKTMRLPLDGLRGAVNRLTQRERR